MHRVEGMAAKAELGRVGLADENRPRRAHPCHVQIIRLRHLPGKQRRSLRGRQARHIGQVLDRHRQPMQRPAHGRIIGRARLLHQYLFIAQIDNRIEPAIGGGNPLKSRAHQLLRADLPALQHRHKIARLTPRDIHRLSPLSDHRL